MGKNIGKRTGTHFIQTWIVGLLLTLGSLMMRAQDTVTWTTNSYPVTGSTLGQIHQSLRQARVTRNNTKWDAVTEWNISWRFSLTDSSGACRVDTSSIQTTIALTLPRWTAPTNATTATREEWRRYVTALAQHELGHAQLAQLAAAGVRKKMSEPPDLSCAELKSRLNADCNTVVENFKKRDQEYDERTRHGETQGAALVVPRPGPR